MQGEYKIYSLSSSENPEVVRYIGYTQKSLARRLNGHRHHAKNKKSISRKAKWIRSVWASGHTILIEELFLVDTLEAAWQTEKDTIKLFKSLGARLVNGTDGGNDIDPGLRERMTERIKQAIGRHVYCFKYDTKELIGDFPTCVEAAKVLDLDPGHVNKIARTEKGVHKGYTFSYTGEFPVFTYGSTAAKNPHRSYKGTQKHYSTSLIVTKGEEYWEFESIGKCAEYFGTVRSVISLAAKNKGVYKGYTLIYKEQPEFSKPGAKDFSKRKPTKSPLAIPVKATKGEECIEFENMTQCAIHFSTRVGYIRTCANNPNRACRGYKIEKVNASQHPSS